MDDLDADLLPTVIKLKAPSMMIELIDDEIVRVLLGRTVVAEMTKGEWSFLIAKPRVCSTTPPPFFNALAAG